jgi:hypothetical protein
MKKKLLKFVKKKIIFFNWKIDKQKIMLYSLHLE